MSTTTQAPKQLDPSASLHAETLGLAPGRGRLQGRRIIVVGAGQRNIVDEEPPIGNGRAMAVLFAREGAHVACIDISKEAADNTVAQIVSEGGKAFTDVVDVSDISAIAPFRYSALLWALALGYFVFGDVPDTMMVIGATIIVLSGLYAFYRERVRHRQVAASASGLPPDGL